MVHPKGGDEPGCALACLSATDQLYILFFPSCPAVPMDEATTSPTTTTSTDVTWEELIYRSYQNKLSKRTTSVADFVLAADKEGQYLCVQLQFILPTVLEQHWASPPQARLLGTSNDGIVMSIAGRDVVVLQLWRSGKAAPLHQEQQAAVEMTAILHQFNIEQICNSKAKVLDLAQANGLFYVLFEGSAVVLFNLSGQIVSTLSDLGPNAHVRLRPHPLNKSLALLDADGNLTVVDLGAHVAQHSASAAKPSAQANIFTSDADGLRRTKATKLTSKVKYRQDPVPSNYGPMSFLQPRAVKSEARRLQLAKSLASPRLPPFAVPSLCRQLLTTPTWTAPQKATSVAIAIVPTTTKATGTILAVNEDNVVIQTADSVDIVWYTEAKVTHKRPDETLLSVFYDIVRFVASFLCIYLS